MALLAGGLLTATSFTSCDKTPTGGAPAAGSPAYTYGTKISFGSGGRGGAYQVSGWSHTEEQFTWSEGDTAVLAIRVPAARTGVALKVRANGFVHPPELTAQPVEVLVNDRKIADWQVGEVAEYAAVIPPELLKDGGLLTFTFKMPKATSPKAAGTAEDPRVLGLCLRELELREVG